MSVLTTVGHRNSTRPWSEQSLVRWATPQLHDIDALDKMVDPLLKGLYPAKSLSRFADVIALCVQVIPSYQAYHPNFDNANASLEHLIWRLISLHSHFTITLKLFKFLTLITSFLTVGARIQTTHVRSCASIGSLGAESQHE